MPLNNLQYAKSKIENAEAYDLTNVNDQVIQDIIASVKSIIQHLDELEARI